MTSFSYSVKGDVIGIPLSHDQQTEQQPSATSLSASDVAKFRFSLKLRLQSAPI